LRRWLKPLRKKQREELREKVWELKSQGLTQEEIAKEVGRTHQDVSWILQKTAKWPNFAETEAELKENTNNTLEPIGISVLDHIIVGRNCFYSMKKEKIL
jgi:orotate phosphoribosyltransferase-like protein